MGGAEKRQGQKKRSATANDYDEAVRFGLQKEKDGIALGALSQRRSSPFPICPAEDASDYVSAVLWRIRKAVQPFLSK